MNEFLLSTSNCGNPCLRFFGFGPVCPNGFGLGYIIKDDSINWMITSKHRQTGKFRERLVEVLERIHDDLILVSPVVEQAGRISLRMFRAESAYNLEAGGSPSKPAPKASTAASAATRKPGGSIVADEEEGYDFFGVDHRNQAEDSHVGRAL